MSTSAPGEPEALPVAEAQELEAERLFRRFVAADNKLVRLWESARNVFVREGILFGPRRKPLAERAMAVSIIDAMDALEDIEPAGAACRYVLLVESGRDRRRPLNLAVLTTNIGQKIVIRRAILAINRLQAAGLEARRSIQGPQP